MRRRSLAIFSFPLVAALLSTCAELSPTGKEAEKDPPCALCHGNPPATGAHTLHAGVYAYDCGLCHPFSGPFHENGATDVGLLRPGDYAESGEYEKGKCSNLYCHGNFDGGANSAADWQGGPIACGTCHSLPPGTHAHASHLLYDCGLCHAGNSVKPPGVFQPLHANGTKNVNGALGSGEFFPADKTCRSVYCHGFGMPDTAGIAWDDGTVGWHDSLSCYGCHDYSSHMLAERQYVGMDTAGCRACHSQPVFHADSTGKIAGLCGTCHGLPPDRGAHVRHTKTNRFSANMDCSVCHLGYRMSDSSVAVATHINGRKDLDGELGGGSYSTVDSSCNSVYCHGNFNGGAHAAPGWFRTGLACGNCHAVPPATGEHDRHVNEKGLGCNNCHPGYSQTMVAVATHVNRAKNVAISGGSYFGGTCSAHSCHGSETWYPR